MIEVFYFFWAVTDLHLTLVLMHSKISQFKCCYLSVCLSVCLICLSVCLSVCLCIKFVIIAFLFSLLTGKLLNIEVLNLAKHIIYPKYVHTIQICIFIFFCNEINLTRS